MKILFFLACALCFQVSVSATSWHVKKSPHFRIYHESGWAPESISIELERIYNMMKMDLSMFSPWMVREKSNIYIYASKRSYLAGEFRPPSWSKGLAIIKKRAVVVYDAGDIEKLRAVISHELTHLYFESYFAEKLKYPPRWLNEGLAVKMEDKSYGSGPWDKALRLIPEKRYMPFPVFFRTKLGSIKDKQAIGDWYLQSFGIVKYLFSPNKRIQFKHFCDLLRDGKKLNAALWTAYRLGDFSDFEREWKKWRRKYSQEEEKGMMKFKFKPFRLSGPKFRKFRSGNSIR